MSDILSFNTDQSWYARWESKLGRLGAALALALAVQAVSYCLYPCPHSSKLSKYIRYATLVKLSEDPFTSEAIPEPTVRHRILVPLLAWATGLRGPLYIVIIYVGNLIFLWLTTILLRQFVPPRIAALSTMLLGTTLALISSQSWPTFQDTWANAAIVACLFFRKHVWSIGPLVFLGMLADERCLAAMPLVFFCLHQDDSPERRSQLRSQRLLFVLLGCAAYAAVYLYLHQHTSGQEYKYYGYEKQEDFVINILRGRLLLEQLPYVPAALWFALRAAWLLPLLLLWHKRRDRAFVFWLLFGLAAATGQALLVEDMSRMASLAFPAVLLAVVMLYASRPALTTLILGMALLVNVLSPQFQINNTRVTMLTPLPLEWLRPEAPEREGK